jgi:hypothetical protein
MTASTTAAPTNSIFRGAKLSNVALTAFTMSHTYTTAELNEINDAVEFGYVPAGVTVVGVLWKSDDVDTHGTPTLTQKITLGSSDVVTGDTTGRAGTGAFHIITPVTTTAPTLVKVTATAAAATAAAGSAYLTFLYHS